MKSLYADIPRHVEYRGHIYRLNLSFDCVLKAFDVLENDDISPDVRPRLAVVLLIKSRRLPDTGILDEVLKIINDLTGTKKPGQKTARAMDFAEDADYIYAAFRQAYGIDLYKERGRLHWAHFIALLKALPDQTRMSQVASLRLRPLPKPTKYNAEERAALMKAKQAVALKSHGNIDDEAGAENLRQLFGALSTNAKKKGV